MVKITQEYLNDQVNSVTENKRSNRNLGTNQLSMDRITGTLADVLKREAPVISMRRDQWRGTPKEKDWGKAELVDPEIDVSGDSGSMTATELTELHYTFTEPSTSYRVGHRLKYVRLGGVWKIENDELDVPPGAPLLLEPYAR